MKSLSLLHKITSKNTECKRFSPAFGARLRAAADDVAAAASAKQLLFALPSVFKLCRDWISGCILKKGVDGGGGICFT